jgi:hypothetical protein
MPDDLIDRQAPTGDPAIAAVIAFDERLKYFGNAFTAALLRLDRKIVSGVPMTLMRGQFSQHRRHAVAEILRPVSRYAIVRLTTLSVPRPCRHLRALPSWPGAGALTGSAMPSKERGPLAEKDG